MTVFVDTSGLFALLDADNDQNALAATAFASFADVELVTHSYVIVECAALVERRISREVAHVLLKDVLATTRIVWVDAAVHRAATSAYLASGARQVSLVDFTSFELMRTQGISRAFAFDRHFADAGFDVIPG